MDASFFDEVNEIIQEEPNTAMDPETLGLLASIGIAHGRPFAPDERMKKILTHAAAVGSATVRALAYRPRDPEARIYPNGAWLTPFVGGSYEFIRDGRACSMRAQCSSSWPPALRQRWRSRRLAPDRNTCSRPPTQRRLPFDGAKTYKLHLPPDIPAKNFWSLVLYDPQTRSMLQTDQQFPSIGSEKKGAVSNPDTSVDVYFGPKAPPGKESNWVQTWPGKCWTVILRLYGPERAFFDKTWRPGEFEEMN